MTELAIKKLRKEYKEGKYDKYAAAMKKDVLQAMEEFCRQDGEFAQAVYQGGSFAECMAAVAWEPTAQMCTFLPSSRGILWVMKG